ASSSATVFCVCPPSMSRVIPFHRAHHPSAASSVQLGETRANPGRPMAQSVPPVPPVPHCRSVPTVAEPHPRVTPKGTFPTSAVTTLASWLAPQVLRKLTDVLDD